MKAIHRIMFLIRGLSTTALVLLTCNSVTNSALAQKSAVATSVKVGYFNLGIVKASYPEAAESEQLRLRAESQLRRDVETGNKRVETAREEKKSAEEIKKLAEKIQLEVTAKQQALAELVQNANADSTARIFQAASSVAQERGLDIVIDGAGVYAGGQKIVDNGVDITQDIVKKLATNSSHSVNAASASAK